MKASAMQQNFSVTQLREALYWLLSSQSPAIQDVFLADLQRLSEENDQVRAAVQKIISDPPEMSEGTCLAEYSDSDTSWTTVDDLQKLLDGLMEHDWIKGIPRESESPGVSG